MTDALDELLARANPVPPAMLGSLRDDAAERLIEAITGRRAPRSPRRRRRVLIVALAALALVVPVALAASQTGLLDFALGGPAPTSARTFLDRMLPPRYAANEGPPQGLTRADIIKGTERLVDAVTTSTGANAEMYAVRLRGGGFCWFAYGLPFNGGGCGGQATGRRSVIGGSIGMGSAGMGKRQAGTFGQGVTLSGPVGAKGAVSLRITYRDGDHGSVPVRDGWVMYEVPLAHTFWKHEPTRIDVLDASGRVLAHRDDPFELHQPARPKIEQPLQSHTVLISRPLGWKGASIELLFARGSKGNECIQARNTARLHWTERWLCDPAVGRNAAITIERPTPPALPISFTWGRFTRFEQPTGYAYVWGWAGAPVTHVEVRFQDSSTVELPLTRHFFLYVVPSVHWTLGTRPSYLIGRDATGKVVYRRFLYPAAHCMYPGADAPCRTQIFQTG